MVWWKLSRSRGETVTASWLGEKLAEMFDPARTLQIVSDWHQWIPDDSLPFLALASLRLVGFQLGATQKSITARINRKVMEQIQLSFIATLIANYANSQDSQCDPNILTSRLHDLAKKVMDAFYANLNDDPNVGPHPVWYAGKEVCMFLQNGVGTPNPGEITTYGEYLHDTPIGAKKLFDDLLAADIDFVE